MCALAYVLGVSRLCMLGVKVGCSIGCDYSMGNGMSVGYVCQMSSLLGV